MVLTPEDKKKYNLEHRRTVARFIKKYVLSLNLPYSVKSFERETGTFFLVMYDEPIQAPVRKTV